MTIRLGLKNAFLFSSQISHISWKREAGRPFGLGPTLTDIWGALQLRTGCLLILIFLTPLAEVTP